MCLNSWMTYWRHRCAFVETPSSFGLSLALTHLLLLLLRRSSASSACIWKSAGKVRCRVSTSSLCARSLPTSSDSPPDPLGARSRSAAPAPLEDRREASACAQKTRSIYLMTAVLTWCVSSGGGGPSYGWESICWLAFCLLRLFFLNICTPLQTWRHRGLTVGAGESGEEDTSDAFTDAGRSCR